MSHLLYLHGFLSSPKSVKAQQTLQWCKQHLPDVTVHIPQLSNYPSQVGPQLQEYLSAHPALLEGGLKVMGSSMGGYLATWLLSHYPGRGVLINPAVKPFELLLDYIGEHVNPYTKETFTIAASDMEALKALDVAHIHEPERFKVLLQTGDEVLDYRLAEQKYAGSVLTIEQGGDHSFVQYQSHLGNIMDFLLGR
ncbi:YqiA/YcfP family alpha/beta fold hydrolase [Alteromonas sp. C1M14]|uniref:YqiA/YcfP family alpha/beta fold hydrolase n=1 Tax=Alteromonas sp. C1M14 TaxID=2841567 RepID=UPI001C080916|nr:YqiA/YcfP family alpha/beta fold hydrolase [Alteromonas sp. C1M14]MBU2977559.1 esterase YqiA [Alteromonas sp. C1M14]